MTLKPEHLKLFRTLMAEPRDTRGAMPFHRLGKLVGYHSTHLSGMEQGKRPMPHRLDYALAAIHAGLAPLPLDETMAASDPMTALVLAYASEYSRTKQIQPWSKTAVKLGNGSSAPQGELPGWNLLRVVGA